jgi:hypothetical protein
MLSKSFHQLLLVLTSPLFQMDLSRKPRHRYVLSATVYDLAQMTCFWRIRSFHVPRDLVMDDDRIEKEYLSSRKYTPVYNRNTLNA